MGGGGSKEGAGSHGDALSMSRATDTLHDDPTCCNTYCACCPCCNVVQVV